MYEFTNNYTAFWQDQKRRKKTLLSECRKLKLQQKEALSMEQLIVDDRLGIIYCQVPKVACTNWRRVLLLLTGHFNTTNPLDLSGSDVHWSLNKHFTYLKDLSSKGVDRRLKNYKKVIFVRDPLERILSAYRNKIQGEKNDYFFKRFGRKIISLFRNRNSTQIDRERHSITFLEFISYLLHPFTAIEGFNAHWQRFHQLCHPCVVNYDFVGKYETLDRDTNFILRDIAPGSRIKFPTRSASYSHARTSDLLLQYYSQIPPEMIRELWRMYSLDYSLFDYPFPDWLLHLNNMDPQDEELLEERKYLGKQFY